MIRQGFGLIEASNRPWILGYVVAALIGSALEAVALASVFGFFSVALNPESIAGIAPLRVLHGWMGGPDTPAFLTGLALLVALAFLVRSGLMVLVTWIGLAFRRRLQLELTRRLTRTYMAQPLIWHLRKGQSRLINNVGSNIGHVCQHVVVGVLDILAAAATSAALLLTMTWLRPWESLIAASLAMGFALLFLRGLRPWLERWSAQTVSASEATWRTVREALQGIKTIKVSGLEKHFAGRVDDAVKTLADIVVHQSMARQTPRFVLESLLVGGVLIAVAAAFARGQSAEVIIPTMVLFAGAAVRLLPQILTLLNLLQYLRLSETPLRTLREDLELPPAPASARPAPMAREEFRDLALHDITFHYEAGRPALRGASLTLRRGEQVALVGLSGAGKTTLVDLLLGLLSPDGGEFRLNGRGVDALPAGLFGYVPQETFLIHDTLRANIVLGDGSVDEARLRRAIDQAALREKVDRLPDGLDTIVSEDGRGFSGGERQRLGIARALYHDAPILIMDEPTSALDAVTEEHVARVLDSLRNERTIIVIAHRLSTVRNFDRILFMADGHVEAEGAFEQLYATHAGFRAMVEYLSVSVAEPESTGSE